MIAIIGVSLFSCSSVFKSSNEELPKPISNPFGDVTESQRQSKGIVFRGKSSNGNSVEVEVPQSDRKITDMVIPMNGQYSGGGRMPASENQNDYYSYKDQTPTETDREIASVMPKNNVEDSWQRNQIEKDLGLTTSANSDPYREKSYLAGLDQIKNHYRKGRFEAGLIETDKLIRVYPTDPKLLSMKGTLLDRLGYHDLALKAWDESLKLNPNNLSLKKFVERKQKLYEGIPKNEN